jgi:hypothetical protein
MSPTQRSLAHVRKQGYALIAVTEHWIPCTPAGFKGPILRKDLYGCVDILCLHEGKVIAIQTTSGSNVSARVTKIKNECSKALEQMKLCGWRILVHGWAKQGKVGKRKLWTLREVEIEL